MTTANLNWITSSIGGIADDVLLRGKYRGAILPMVVIRRRDAVLEPTRQACWASSCTTRR